MLKIRTFYFKLQKFTSTGLVTVEFDRSTHKLILCISNVIFPLIMFNDNCFSVLVSKSVNLIAMLFLS